MQPGTTDGKTSGRPLRERLRALYDGPSPEAHRFRYGLLALDLGAVAFIVATSFFERSLAVEIIDVTLGIVFLADFVARLWISRRPVRDLFSPIGLADLAAILSFLAPLVVEGVAFLRVLRTLRLLHSYQLLRRLRADFPFFRHNEEALIAALHLCIFLFVMTGLVYETQNWRNDQINNYVDAVYFTVTALTTTGFGDITLEGTGGRLLAVIVMICGVTLFLRLAQVLFRPNKVRHECPTCGLLRHEPDAVHCKHCGEVIHLQTEGAG